ncbi:MAG TPA: ABC transporter permease [Chloroflexota bacterium]|nr:ABC transporter permease [Chloroflexota bacterium]
MTVFLVRRLGFLLFVVFGVSIITFVISHLVPADPVGLVAGKEASPAKLALIRHTYGLDQPLPVQYVAYMGHLLRGDLGLSTFSRRPVLDDFLDYFPATVELTLFSMLLCVGVGLPLGVYSGLQPRGWLDHLTRIISVAGTAMPLFWFGLLLQLFFYGQLGWLPEAGRLGLMQAAPRRITGLFTLDSLLTLNLPALGDSLKHLVLPSITLAISSLALVVRVTRASVLDVVSQDYVRTARAKGVPRRALIRRHILRNALIPTTTLLGLQVGNLLSGAFLVEVVFSWPGIGLYSTNTIRNFDYQAIMSITIIVAVIYSLVNTVIDLVYTQLDPRIELG